MKHLSVIMVCWLHASAALVSATDFQPADPELSSEARAVFDYLVSVYGKRTLLGQNKFREADKIKRFTGKTPAIISVDLSGWHKQRWSDRYRKNLDRAINDLIAHSRNGGIASLEWHWANPLSLEGTYNASKKKYLAIDVGRVVTPGTDEHEQAMTELKMKADVLQRLADARVPVLWRPLHEIDGGWFWWTDIETPENTAKLWRMMFEYFVHERHLHNLIWVYCAGLKAGDKGKDIEAIDYRRRFYPGSNYVDIAGMDIYVNDWYGWKDYRVDSYPLAKEIMKQVAPGKMLALTECEGIPKPELIRQQGTDWLYCLSWYVGQKGWNPPTWVEKCYPHEQFLTLDDLPDFTAARTDE